MRPHVFGAAALAAALLVFGVHAVARAGDGVEMPPKRTLEARRVTGPLVVDGRLDETDWVAAPGQGEWTQRYPRGGEKPSFPTEVRVLYDEQSLYVGVTCFDPEPEKIDLRMARRDRELPMDAVQIEFDTQLQGREGYYFRVSAAGTRIDAFSYNEFNLNYSWDANWEGKAAMFEGGWCAEFRIPFSELRFNDSEHVQFGFQVQRDIGRLQEWNQWQFNPPNSNRRLSAFGLLTGLKGIAPGHHLEFTPYAVAKARTHTRQPYFDRGLAFDGGFDFRYALGTNFTVNGTVNPDFGQVEADRIVLNLSTYETFYPEKRPFFLEGFQIFSPPEIGNLIYLHTRRIGGPPPPPWAPEGSEIASAPEQTTILAAAKVTGTTNSGLTFGAFTALTQAESADLQASDGSAYEQQLVPRTLYSVVRVTQEVGPGSTVGFLATDVERQEGRDALVTALTWDLKFRQNQDQLTGSVARSLVNDPLSRSWTGYGGELRYSVKPAERWTLIGSLRAYDPDFRVNDLGYLRRNDYRQATWGVAYNHETEVGGFLNWNGQVNVYGAQNFDQVLLARGLNFNAHGTLKNYWSLFAGGEINGSCYDDRETRGGPLFRRVPATYIWWGFETDSRKPLQMEFWTDQWTTRHGWGWDAGLDLSYQVSDRLSLTPSVMYNNYSGDFRWVDTLPGAGAGGADQHLFADLSLKEASLSGRASYLFTPDMTLDLYFQVFDATGHYTGFQEMLASDRFAPASYSSNPDFHDLGMALNLVYRWEFRPGGVFYAVYGRGQQGGKVFDDHQRGGDLDLRRDWSALVNTPRDEVFLVKISYLF